MLQNASKTGILDTLICDSTARRTNAESNWNGVLEITLFWSTFWNTTFGGIDFGMISLENHFLKNGSIFIKTVQNYIYMIMNSEVLEARSLWDPLRNPQMDTQNRDITENHRIWHPIWR